MGWDEEEEEGRALPGNSGSCNQLISTLSVVMTTVNKENDIINNGNTFAGEGLLSTPPPRTHHLIDNSERRSTLRRMPLLYSFIWVVMAMRNSQCSQMPVIYLLEQTFLFLYISGVSNILHIKILGTFFAMPEKINSLCLFIIFSV